MALLLKENGHDAVSISYDWNSNETFEMMCYWAEKIIPMREKFIDRIPEEYHNKILKVDIGEDIWGNPLNKDLWSKCIDIMKQYKLGANENKV